MGRSRNFSADETAAIATFPVVAQDFLRLIEDFECYEKEAFIRKISAHLARLCEVATRLPRIIYEDDSSLASETELPIELSDTGGPEAKAHAEKYFRVKQKLEPHLRTVDAYWEIFDPTQENEPVQGTLSGDLAEIFLDMETSLKLLNSGAPAEDIYWQWNFDFRAHWFRHASSALRVTLTILSRLDTGLPLAENLE